jgi:hypothetical protein
MLNLNIHNVFSNLDYNDDNKSFTITTLAIGTQRLYRITRETPLSHYDFKVNLSGYTQGQLVKIRIPYRNSDYSLASSGAVDINTVPFLDPGAPDSGELLQGHTFKCVYLESNAYEQYVPSLIDHTATYSIEDTNVRFVLFTVMNGVAKLTGNMGNLAITNPSDAQNVLQMIDITKATNTITQNGTVYHFIRLRPNSTPNIVRAPQATIVIPPGNGGSGNAFVDEYNDGTYDFVMSISGNGFAGVGFIVSVNVKRMDNEEYDRDAPTFVSTPPGDIASVVLQETAGDNISKTYTYVITSRPGISSIDFRAV